MQQLQELSLWVTMATNQEHVRSLDQFEKHRQTQLVFEVKHNGLFPAVIHVKRWRFAVCFPSKVMANNRSVQEAASEEISVSVERSA